MMVCQEIVGGKMTYREASKTFGVSSGAISACFRVSMSAVGTPNENAFIEAFFKTLKAEEVYARNYQDIEDVMRPLPHFIEQIYNKERLHSSLGYLSPVEFECKILELKPALRPVQQIWGKAV